MKKRILSILLALALVLGMCPASVLAEEAETPVYKAAYSAAVTADGTLTENAWLVDGVLSGETNRSFGALWDSDNLYLAAIPQSGDGALTVTLGDYTLTVAADGAASGVTGAAAAVGDAVEVQIPLDAIGVTLNSYDLTVPMTLSLGGASWEGELGFQSLERGTYRPSMNLIGYQNNFATAQAGNLMATPVADGYQLYNKYIEGSTNAASGRVYTMQTGAAPLVSRSGTLSLEFDLVIDSMPEYKTAALTGAFVCYGFNLALSDATGAGIVTGITNMADGLNFSINSASESFKKIPIGKTLGEEFHVQLVWTMSGDVSLYIDGVLIEVFAGAEHNGAQMKALTWTAANMLGFNLYSDNSALTGPESDIDFTFSNVRFGAMKGQSVLENLTFAVIKGENSDPQMIGSKLNLPQNWDNGQLKPVELDWSSSNPAVIANDGTVYPTTDKEEVTLTASVKGGIDTRSFDLVVDQMSITTVFTEETMTVDGAMSETGWPELRALNAVSGDGAPVGSVSSVWYQERLYFAVTYTDATELALSLEGVDWTVNLSDGTVTGENLTAAVGDGVVELCVDLAGAGLKLMDYGVQYSIQIALTGAGGTTKLESQPILLRFSCERSHTVDWTATTADGIINVGVAATASTASFDGAESAEVIITTNSEYVDHDKGVLTQMTVNVQSMPISTGAVSNNWTADGLLIFMIDKDVSYNPSNGDDPVNFIAAGMVLYNTANGLMLRVRQGGNVATGTVVNLGKKAGEGSFKLGFVWDSERLASGGSYGTLEIYVDGMLLQSVGGTNYNYNAHSESLNFRYNAKETVYFSISDLSFNLMGYSSIQEEATESAVLAGVNLSAVGEDVTLPETFASKYLGTLPLSWVSADETLLGNDGTVNRPEGKVGRYVDLTAYIGSQALFTTTVYILPTEEADVMSSSLLTVPFTAAAVSLNGVTTDEGWNLNTKVQDTAGNQVGRFGVQWDMTNLYLAADNGGNAMTVTINDVAIDLTGAAVSGNIVETAVSLESLGVTITDYGVELPAKVTMGAYAWEGILRLTSTDWCATDGVAPRLSNTGSTVVKLGGDAPTANQGFAQTTDGYRFYDLYDSNGSNPTLIRSAVCFVSALNNAAILPIGDRSVASFMEFDFQAKSMPVYTLGEATGWNALYASYGFCWWMTADEDSLRRADSVSLGIFNTEKGLMLAANGSNLQTMLLNKSVGDLFRVGVRWEINGDVTVFIDGEYLDTFESMTVPRQSIGDVVAVLNLVRGKTPAASKNDDFDLYITNIALGKNYGEKLIDSLNFDAIRGENELQYAVTSDLVLPDVLANDQLTTDLPITWISSDPSVVSNDGTVTRAEKGKLVTLTAMVNGQTVEIEIYVKGTGTELDVLIAENDLNTANGAGVAEDIYLYTLDTDNNSVIRDLKEKQTVNVIALQDGDESNRLNESTLAIWVSDDNVTYTRVDSFKLLRTGGTIYLYDFEATGRYIKVHCTHYNGDQADFTGPLYSMIDAYYEEVFGDNGGEFTGRSQYNVTNDTSVDSYDDAWTLETEAQRVYLGDELLYHYVENGKTVVRIPEIAAGQTVVVTVLTGNDTAMDTANKEYVHEAVYGTREATLTDGYARWITALPDGRLINIFSVDWNEDNSYSGNYLGYTYSYDGLTWTEPVGIECSDGDSPAVGSSAAYYDEASGRLFGIGFTTPNFVANDYTLSDLRTVIVYSDDLGETWTRCDELTMEGEPSYYTLTYTAPIRVEASYDGEDGDGVDFVFPCGTQSDRNDASFDCRVAYSTDCGKTWHLSASKISYTGGEGLLYKEGGVSEGTIEERADGTLVLYARCQFESVDTFARSYSYDHGITWVEEAELSDIYTVNTQPMMHQFGENVLMTWGGNTVLGGNSYARYPLSIGVSYDGLMTFENIQDVFSRYSLQGMTTAEGNWITNQSIANYGDTFYIVWTNSGRETVHMKIDNFTDYFFRSKGAYDSFETSTSKYEGWATTAGTVQTSDAQATEGSRSLMIVDGSGAVRSIPYLQDGSISMDLYVESAAADLTLELESAYGTEFGKAAPIALNVVNGVIGDTGLTLNEGWNTVSFDLALTGGDAVLTVNGETAELTPNLEIGDYICYVDINAGNTVCYVDAFTVLDGAPVDLPEEPAKPEAPAEKFDLYGANMKLGNNLSMNFFVSMANVTGEGWYAEIARGDDVLTIDLADCETSGGYYKITYPGFAAKEMTDEVVVTIYDADGNAVSNPWTDSIRTYAMRILDNEAATDADKTLMVDMLNYGAAAQNQFTYKTNDLANALLNDEQKAYATKSVELTNKLEAGESYYGTSLNLKTNIQMNVYFTDVTEDMTAAITYTNHNGEAKSIKTEVVMSGIYGKVTVDQMVVSDADCLITVTVMGTDGNTVATVTDSVASYAARTLDEQPLNVYLMKFCRSAWKSLHTN